MTNEKNVSDPSSIIQMREHRKVAELAEAGKYHNLKKVLLVIFAILVAGPIELFFIYYFGL